MAYGDNSTINTNRLTQAFNRILQANSPLDIVSKQSPFVAATLGSRSIDKKLTYATPNFSGLEKLSGNQLESVMMGQLRGIGTAANGSAEIGSITPALYAPFVSQVWTVTHYTDAAFVGMSEVQATKDSDIQKVGRALDNHAKYIAASYADQIGQDVHQTSSNNVQSDQYLGSWVYAVDDTNVYGTIDRSATGNAVFKGNVYSNVGSLTLVQLDTAIDKIREKGKADFGCFGTPEWTIFKTLLRSNQLPIINNGETAQKYGQASIVYQGVTFAQDPYTPGGYCGIFTTDTWKWGAQVFKQTVNGAGTELMISSADFVRAQAVKAAYEAQTDLFCAFVCEQPNANAKITGITG